VDEKSDISETVAAEIAFKKSEEKYRVMYEDLLADYQKLTASEKELRKQYKVLRISEEKYSRIFDLSPDMIAVSRLKDGLYIDVNPGFLMQGGCTKEEVIGKTSLELGIWSIQDRERMIAGLKNQGEVRNLETRLQLKNGSIIHVLLSARVMDINDEKYLLTVTRNITERKEMENQLRQNEKRLNDILNKLPVAVSYCDNAGKILFMNPKLIELYGYTIEDTPTLDTWSEKTFPDEKYRKTRLNDWYMEIEKYKHALIKEPITMYGLYTCKDGTLKDTEATSIIEGNYTYVVFNDITKRKRAEEILKISERKYRTIFEAASVGIYVHDIATGDIFDVNEKGCELVGYTREEILSGNFEIFMSGPPYDKNEALRRIRLAANGMPQLLEWRKKHKDGHHIWAEVSCKRTMIGNDEYVLVISRDITERKRMEEQLQYQSLHDSLTQLHNRAFFEEQVRQLQKARVSSTGLLICDVDGLKIINDTLGHTMGDLILQVVAKILRDSFRAEDLVSRIGGDEFAVLLSANSLTELAAGSKRILKRIEEHNLKNPTVPISLSIGYAISEQTAIDMDSLFKEADNNMYRVKLHRQKSVRNSIVLALMKALEARDFLTEGHGERLQNLIQSFAGIIGLPENNLADLRLFAQFHDIGKVGIPDSILFKPGCLTGEEWIVMRRHCEIGYRIAMSAPDLAPIADWILKHQEWWNGNGYPSGLKGEDIPLECRMLSIIDAYDAMTSDRPYRKAMSREAAFAELKRYAGSQFDPILVKQFVSMLRCNLVIV
jgi:diguanylate cyclase (GGDEF)-like protein/PAS domain S-box-containing protein